MKILPIKNVTCYQLELSIFLLGSCTLYRKKALSQKLSFRLLKKKRLLKNEEKNLLE